MQGFLDAASKIGKFSLRWDDDFCDRLSHRYTVILCIVFTVVVSAKQYVGDPITCWCPGIFTEAMIEYTNHICYVSNTYYVPMSRVAPGQNEPREVIIGYYQWIPLILVLHALMFHTPSLVWGMFNNRSGMDINRMVLLVSSVEHINPDVRDKTIKFLIRHVDRSLNYQRERRDTCYRNFCQRFSRRCCVFTIGRVYGNYLVCLYIVVKLLYISNAIGQLWLINILIGYNEPHRMWYGIDIVKSIWTPTKANIARIFPTVTLCDFDVRQMSNVHAYTVQCALTINVFNEKIYTFLWFWFLFVAAMTIFSLISMAWSLFAMNRIAYVKHYLRNTDKIKNSSAESKLVKQFVHDYLKHDGVMVLRLIGKNSNDLVVSEIISAMWESYKKTYKPNKLSKPGPQDGSQPSVPLPSAPPLD